MCERSSHAATGPAARRRKAEKIRTLVEAELRGGIAGTVLEIGAGSGLISEYFATCVPGVTGVDAVDVRDQRVARDGYRFQAYAGDTLPFDDARFDLVISNHVIEHVGDRDAQAAHLREIRRVLRHDGLAYLACPSRWQLVEPHFRLPVLSWIPRGLRDAYVRICGRGPRYDCDPLGHREIERMLDRAGLAHVNRNVAALRATAAIEGTRGALGALLRRIPDRVLAALYRASPTMVYVARRADGY